MVYFTSIWYCSYLDYLSLVFTFTKKKKNCHISYYITMRFIHIFTYIFEHGAMSHERIGAIVNLSISFKHNKWLQSSLYLLLLGIWYCLPLFCVSHNCIYIHSILVRFESQKYLSSRSVALRVRDNKFNYIIFGGSIRIIFV